MYSLVLPQDIAMCTVISLKSVRSKNYKLGQINIMLRKGSKEAKLTIYVVDQGLHLNSYYSTL